jgi:hypothetical protein
MKKLFFLLILVFLVSFVSSQSLDNLGSFEVNKEVRITQTCYDANYINISSITFPDSTIAESNIEMAYVGSGEFYYDFNQTSELGRYDVRGISDGCTNTFATYFLITTNGKDPPEGIVIVIFTLIFVMLVAFGLLYFIISLGHLVQLDMDLLDATVMISNYLGLWVFYYVSYEYLGNAVMNDILELAISIGAVTHVFLPLVGFLVSFIMTNLKFKQKARITY